jgi:DNA-binding transcriptional ArsR family regulator
MITIKMVPDDLVKMRFAYRPLLEIPLSYRVLINPNFQSPYGRWLEEAYPALYDANLPYLRALIPPEGYIPDFLTQTPLSNRVSIEDDIADVLATPDAIIRGNVQELIKLDGDSEIRRYFVAHPREAVRCLADDLRVYWQRTLAHHWPQMIAILESDILHHARMMALDGPGDLFADLHPTVSYRDHQLDILPLCMHRHDQFVTSLTGEGIQLSPVVFGGCGRAYQVSPEWRPMLAYAVRGAGQWRHTPQSPSRSLELALGTGRARLLQTLKKPASTGELAHRLGVSAGAISQQLNRLTMAGLVEPHRSGKRVFHHLTWRGEELLNLFERNF